LKTNLYNDPDLYDLLFPSVEPFHLEEAGKRTGRRSAIRPRRYARVPLQSYPAFTQGNISVEETSSYDAALQVRDVLWYLSTASARDFPAGISAAAGDRRFPSRSPLRRIHKGAVHSVQPAAGLHLFRLMLEFPSQEIVMRTLILFIAVSIGLAQAPPAEAPGIKSVGTMSELMLYIIYPKSDELFYVDRKENKTLADWFELRNNALILAESANLLMADNRAKDKGRWMKDATLLWEVANKAFIAAKAKDQPAIEALNAELYESCQSCHVHYRPGYRRRP
jgi:hypothetical protein